MEKILLTLVAGGLGGSFLTIIFNSIKGKMQIMKCHYLEDDILSKIPQKNEDESMHQNVYCKTFELINTTNKDISEFRVIFQFDSSVDIIECYSTSKEGYNRQSIKKSKQNKNEAVAVVRQFNRKDRIKYTFRTANVTNNNYYITESNCTGFKIKCKDKRKHTNKSKSNQSDQVLIERH